MIITKVALFICVFFSGLFLLYVGIFIVAFLNRNKSFQNTKKHLPTNPIDAKAEENETTKKE